jgi:hypothetical protein
MNAIAQSPSFGHYELLARLGDGGRGPVFAACLRGRDGQREAGSERFYALEVIAFASGDDDAVRAFVHDIERAAHVEHRNMVAVVEHGVTDAGHYVVTDTLDSATLAELEDRHRAIRPPRLVLATGIDALRGLHAAHSLSIDGIARPLLHGSLSPAHLRIGVDGACRVSGFGSVRPQITTKPSHRSRVATGYMSPEQLTGGEVDHRADLFSLGVVLWNALTGKKLFHDRIEHMTMSNVLERRVPRPSAVALSPPPAFDAVVLKALERDPARRFSDAAEMAEALRDAAKAAACLASDTEVAEWVAVTFGGELAARRRAIGEIASRAALPLPPELTVLPPLTGAADHVVRDELTLDELARASSQPPRGSTVPELAPITTVPALAPIGAAPVSYPAASARRQLALVALAAFGVVACVLGWRWALVVATTEDAPAFDPAGAPMRAPPPVELEVTILDMRPVPVPETAPAPTAASTAAAAPTPTSSAAAPIARAAASPTPPHPAAPAGDGPAAAAPAAPAAPASDDASTPASSPARSVVRLKRPFRPTPPAPHADPPEVKPAEPRVEPPPPAPPPKPEPPRPTLEPNPYLQK